MAETMGKYLIACARGMATRYPRPGGLMQNVEQRPRITKLVRGFEDQGWSNTKAGR